MERLEEFLAGRRIACLATENPDGSAYLTAVWFLYEEGAVYVGTSGTSRKARNAAERPRTSIMVDSRGPKRQRGFSASGAVRALLVEGGDAVYLAHWMRQSGLAALLPSLDRTVWVGLSAGSMAMTPRVGEYFVETKPSITGDDVTLRLDPGLWRSWSTAEDFGGLLDAPGLSLPIED